MTWENLSKTDAKDTLAEKQAALFSIAKNYHTCFTSDAGKKVLDHLVKTYVMSNETQFNSPNITYEAGYHAGEAGVVKMILNQLQRAKT